MITYYATSPHGYTFEKYLALWAPDLDARVVGYSELDLAAPPAPGLHILTDFERLLGPERAFVGRLHRRLSRTPGLSVIGDPSRWLDRHALLRVLHEEGINDFRAFTLDELGGDLRFPVFLRWANEHGGTLGGPIQDRRTLDRRIAAITHEHHRRMRWIRDQLLVVEKVDAVSQDGLFRKYSIARIGEEYLARHVEVSGNWVTKYPSVVRPETVAEEEAFLAEPRDLDLVKRVFELSGIEYGRIDWGYAGGRPQIWEINTNPMVAPSAEPHELRAPSQRRQAALVRSILEAQVPTAGGAPRANRIPAPERWVWGAVNRASRRWDPRRG